MKRWMIAALLVLPCVALGWDDEPSFDEGYDYGQSASDISDCTAEFGSYNEAYDGCAEAVSEHGGEFHGYECTDDCSGHQAGWDWAESRGITDPDDCGGNSRSFREGCEAYAEENG